MAWSFAFFFQAEDGIRDGRVTGVQTCALPIFLIDHDGLDAAGRIHSRDAGEQRDRHDRSEAVSERSARVYQQPRAPRSEERRVGKECRARGWRDHVKKKKPAYGCADWRESAGG